MVVEEEYELAIPNHEVKRIYEERLLEWVAQKLQVDSDECESLIRLLATGAIEGFSGGLQKLLDQSTRPCPQSLDC
ncbi:MAG: hypothetical protein AAFV97_00440 [Bacteroidota bacterium]